MTGAGLEISILVFREGLECVLVLAAIMASMTGLNARLRRPVAVGVGVGLLATLLTWRGAVRLVDDLSESIPALYVQAITGLLAVIVLLIVMNWFFHKIYWTGWIDFHTSRKRRLMASASPSNRSRLWFGLAALGFTSLYREGVEVILFLQSYRLRLGPGPVRTGVAVGFVLTCLVAVCTFFLHRRLPYRRMLILTGIMLAGVLFVMVGEQAQEMQLAHWLPTTEIGWLVPHVKPWMQLWLSVFPTVETLVAQVLSVVLVLGSYFAAQSGIVARIRAGHRAPTPTSASAHGAASEASGRSRLDLSVHDAPSSARL